MVPTPMPSIQSSMKQQFHSKVILLSIFLLPLAFPMGIMAAGLTRQTVSDKEEITPSSTISQEKTVPAREPLPAFQDREQQVGTPEKKEGADILTMKQRYRQDPTGVRARLGLCRKGKGGPGNGPPGGFRGGKRWDTE